MDRAAFVVVFEPRRGAAYDECAPGFYNDWQADHGPQMDGPRWVPLGGSHLSDGGVIADKQAWVDCGHVLREKGAIERRYRPDRRSHEQ